MSARVFNPVVFSEFYKIRSPMTFKRHPVPCAAARARVKRDLFGPIDREDSKIFITRELAKQQEQAAERWGFDFSTGNPINNHHQFVWERVPHNGVPGMYTLSRAAHVREIQTDDISNMLLDVRAERELRDDSDLKLTTENNKGQKQLTNNAGERKTSSGLNRVKRQPKITDFLKEKKRLATSSVKRLTSPKKRKTLSVSPIQRSH